MSILKNPVQTFIRNLIRLVVLVPLWLVFALHFFVRGINGGSPSQFIYGGLVSLVVLWLANILAAVAGKYPCRDVLHPAPMGTAGIIAAG